MRQRHYTSSRANFALDKQSFYSDLGNRLKAARKTANMTQSEVAGQLQVTQEAISNYERGRKELSSLQLLQFSKLYNRPVSYFYMSPPK